MRTIAFFLVALLLVASPVMAQDAAAGQSQSLVGLAGSAVVWSLLSVVIAQVTSIVVLWLLGLPPRKLAHEIQDVQNPAVGAFFFIISLTAAIFVGFMTTDGFTPDPPGLEAAAWIIGGVLLGFVITIVLFFISHRIMGKQPNESLYQYIQREIVLEQNAALAFFLGGLAVTPFISIVFQLI